MDGSLDSGFVVGPWASAFAMYLFGIATGWLVWGATRVGRRQDSKVNVAPLPEGWESTAAGAALSAIEIELKNTRALMDQGEGDVEAFSEALTDLDASIKRANGRLKLLLRSVQKPSSEA